MTGAGFNTIANLYENDTCSISIGLLDAAALVAEPPKGYVSCAASLCGGPHAYPHAPGGGSGGRVAVPPSTPPNTSVGFCVGPAPAPPKPPTPACRKAIDTFCNDPAANKACVVPTVKAYPNAQPFAGRFDAGCAVEPRKLKPVPVGPCQRVSEAKSWKCYSHLALDAATGGWSNAAAHPNAYCSEAASIEAVLATC